MVILVVVWLEFEIYIDVLWISYFFYYDFDCDFDYDFFYNMYFLVFVDFCGVLGVVFLNVGLIDFMFVDLLFYWYFLIEGFVLFF